MNNTTAITSNQEVRPSNIRSYDGFLIAPIYRSQGNLTVDILGKNYRRLLGDMGKHIGPVPKKQDFLAPHMFRGTFMRTPNFLQYMKMEREGRQTQYAGFDDFAMEFARYMHKYSGGTAFVTNYMVEVQPGITSLLDLFEVHYGELKVSCFVGLGMNLQVNTSTKEHMAKLHFDGDNGSRDLEFSCSGVAQRIFKPRHGLSLQHTKNLAISLRDRYSR
jgi:hypothetical protein